MAVVTFHWPVPTSKMPNKSAPAGQWTRLHYSVSVCPYICLFSVYGSPLFPSWSLFRFNFSFLSSIPVPTSVSMSSRWLTSSYSDFFSVDTKCVCRSQKERRYGVNTIHHHHHRKKTILEKWKQQPQQNVEKQPKHHRPPNPLSISLIITDDYYFLCRFFWVK